MNWTEEAIARSLAMQVFHRRALVMVPNCSWTGDECDLLVVRNDLRLVDVEVKISRADLKADAHKEKWIDTSAYAGPPSATTWIPPALRTRIPRTHPRKIWKHYYALPQSVWKDGLESCIPEASGVLFMRLREDGSVGTHVHRQAKPAKNAETIALEEVIDIARVCSVRYWAIYDRVRPKPDLIEVSP